MLHGEVGHGILWIALIIDRASMIKLWAVSAPGGVGVAVACDAAQLTLVFVEGSTVCVATGATDVGLCLAFRGEVTPSSALHALDRLDLLLLWPHPVSKANWDAMWCHIVHPMAIECHMGQGTCICIPRGEMSIWR